MFKIDITLPPPTAGNLESYRRKLETRIDARAGRALTAGRLALVLAVLCLGTSWLASVLGLKDLAVAIASVTAGMLAFLIPVATGLRIARRHTTYPVSGARVLLLAGLAGTAAAGLWFGKLATEGAVPDTLLAGLPVALAAAWGWRAGRQARERMVKYCAELEWLEPVTPQQCREIHARCGRNADAARYREAVSRLGRPLTGKDLDAVRRCTAGSWTPEDAQRLAAIEAAPGDTPSGAAMCRELAARANG